MGWELQIVTAHDSLDGNLFFFGLRKAGLRSGLPDWIDVIVFSDTELSLVPGLFRVLREAEHTITSVAELAIPGQ